MRLFVLALALGLSQEACLAYALAGTSAGAPAGVERSSIRPEEPDARLTCSGSPCSEVPLARDLQSGRSGAIFGTVYALEIVGMAGAYYGAASSLQSSDTGTGAALSLVGTALIPMIIGDTIMIAGSHDEFGVQRSRVRLGQDVLADFRGSRLPLELNDVVPAGVTTLPQSFSLVSALDRHAARAEAVRRAPSMPEPLERKDFGLFGGARGNSASQQPVQAQLVQAPASRPSGRAGGDAVPRGGKVAVLDFKSYAQDLSPADVRYFTDLVRGATLKSAPGLSVMTRENLLVLLQASGKDAASCEGECEVDTGRRIGADAVISGDILKLGTHYKMTLRLHETRNGRLLSSAIASGKTVDELDEGASNAAAELLAPLR